MLSAAIRKKLSASLRDIQVLTEKMKASTRVSEEELEQATATLCETLYLDIRRGAILDKEKTKEIEMGLENIRQMGGIPLILEFSSLVARHTSSLSAECFGWTVNLLEWICTAPQPGANHLNVNGRYILLTNKTSHVIDLLLLSIKDCQEPSYV